MSKHLALKAPTSLLHYARYGTFYHVNLEPKDISSFKVPTNFHVVLVEITKPSLLLADVLSSQGLAEKLAHLRNVSFILPHVPFSGQATTALALNSIPSFTSHLNWCVRVEGVDEEERRVALLELGKQGQVHQIALPPYIPFKERLELAKESFRPVRILETGPKVVEETKAFFALKKVISVSTSLPVRLGCIGRTLEEATPEPPTLEDTEDLYPAWTKNIIQTFLEQINGGRE